MDQLAQSVIVAILVLTSAVFAAWRLAPARTKLRLLNALSPTSTNPIGRWLLRLRKRVTDELTHGCNACSSSNSVKKHAAPR
jgi:hypothetical protein